MANGPITRGFDYYFGVDVPNYPPYCYIENNKTIGIPKLMRPEHMYGNPGYTNAGPMVRGWKLENIMPDITKKAVGLISEQEGKISPAPFLFTWL